MNPYTIIELKNIRTRTEELHFKSPINWQIDSDQHWAVVGANGAGKSLLIDILLQKHALHHSCKILCWNESGDEVSIRKTVKHVGFKDIYSLVDTTDSFYQQRWNKGLETDVTTVSQLIAEEDKAHFAQLVDFFAITDLVDKEVNLLSSGELRKILIVRALLSQAKILVLDNPFIGLDSESRIVLNDLLDSLSRHNDLQIIVVVPDSKEIPSMVTHVLPIKDRQVYPAVSREDFLNDEKLQQVIFEEKVPVDINKLKALYTDSTTNKGFDNAIILKDICIRYGNRTILKDLNWNVRRGEKWALLGANGSGKSTLLSLVYGDNPQAYANDITLFDRKRGSGESIWDIKKQIGYISPEMHLYYLKNVRCVDVVSSGFFDTVGLYRKCTSEQETIAHQWMQAFGIEHLKETSFLKISTGEQRLVLLARVLVKNPNLLILDEPMHGLDAANKRMIKKILEDFCGDNKTLIYVTHYQDEIPGIVDKELKLVKRA